eukprot:3164777-Prorocentrum_lima.AAC.1
MGCAHEGSCNKPVAATTITGLGSPSGCGRIEVLPYRQAGRGLLNSMGGHGRHLRGGENAGDAVVGH